MAEEKLTIRMMLLGAAQAARESRQVADAQHHLGDEVQGAGRKAQTSGRGWGIFRREAKDAERQAHSTGLGIGRLAKAGAGLGIGLGALHGLRESIDATDELGLNTLKLQRVMGGSVKDASTLAAILKVYGVDGKQGAQSFGILSKNIEAALAGGKQMAAFQGLGIGEDLLRTGDTGKIFGAVADAFKTMPAGAQRSAIGMQLFGRSWQTLLPLLAQGSAGIDEWRQKAIDAGAVFEDVRGIKDHAKALKESKLATLGLQIAVGETLTPALTKLLLIWPALVRDVREGNGSWGTVRTIIDGVSTAVGTVVGWFRASKTATDALVVGLSFLAVAWGVEKVIGYARAIRELTLVTKGLALANWALSGSAGAATVAESALIARSIVLLRYAGPVAAFVYGTGILNPDTAGLTPEVEHARLRQAHAQGKGGLTSDQMVGWYETHPAALRRDVGILPAWQRGPLRAWAKDHHQHIPGLWKGGRIRDRGAVLVGEKGPELLTGMQGARVDPLSGGGGLGEVVALLRRIADKNPDIYLDREKVGSGVTGEFLTRELFA